MDIALSARTAFDLYYVWQHMPMEPFFILPQILCMKGVLMCVCCMCVCLCWGVPYEP